MQRPKRRENMRGMTAPSRCFAGPKLALALSFLAAVPLFGCSEPVQEEFIRPVRSMVVGDAAAFREDSFPGRAKAVQEVDLAFEVTGQLRREVVERTLSSRSMNSRCASERRSRCPGRLHASKNLSWRCAFAQN